MSSHHSVWINIGPVDGLNVEFKAGSSVFFVGANGSGKTRLAEYIERSLGEKAHRISAHRALGLDPGVSKIPEHKAEMALRYGILAEAKNNITARVSGRWRNNPSSHLLNDFDQLLQLLYAERVRVHDEYHKIGKVGKNGPWIPTKFDRLTAIWQHLLPQRELIIGPDDIKVQIVGKADQYSASELSDGERAIFYMIGQVLVAKNNSVFIMDEPELHVHRSILSSLWDQLEAERKDCAFIFVTHDLEFAASRVGQKFVVHSCDPAHPKWTGWSINAVPETGFDEEITTLILGSRRPILFVEGDKNSLDQSIYRACYPGWTVIPRGSCEEVIHSVASMRNNASLTRIHCAGIVDHDSRTEEETQRLSQLGVKVLAVSEIENLILLPEVSRAIATLEGYTAEDLETKLTDLKDAVIRYLSCSERIDRIVVRSCRRQIESALGQVNFAKCNTVQDLEQTFHATLEKFNVQEHSISFRERIEKAIKNQNLAELLAHCDDKGLMDIAARHLRNQRKKDFESWLTRHLRNSNYTTFADAFHGHLPKLEVKGVGNAAAGNTARNDADRRSTD